MSQTYTSTNISKKEMFKALNGADFEMRDHIGERFHLKGFIQVVKEKDGEEVILTVLIDKTGKSYSTVSPTVANSLAYLAESFCKKNEDGKYELEIDLEIEIVQKKSKNNRNFLQLNVI